MGAVAQRGSGSAVTASDGVSRNLAAAKRRRLFRSGYSRRCRGVDGTERWLRLRHRARRGDGTRAMGDARRADLQRARRIERRSDSDARDRSRPDLRTGAERPPRRPATADRPRAVAARSRARVRCHDSGVGVRRVSAGRYRSRYRPDRRREQPRAAGFQSSERRAGVERAAGKEPGIFLRRAGDDRRRQPGRCRGGR